MILGSRVAQKGKKILRLYFRVIPQPVFGQVGPTEEFLWRDSRGGKLPE
jgi:hypothetical protein